MGLLLAVFTALVSIANVDKLYIVGGFNKWNINSPMVATLVDGLLEAEIDFSDNQAFKMSAVDPKGSWETFDTGTLYPSEKNIEANTWIDLEERPVSPNITAPMARKLVVKVDMANMKMMFWTDYKEPDPWSGTLPVMFITTENRTPITSKEKYVDATYYLDPMGVEGIEAVASAQEPATLHIRGRGNYTWVGFDKKPYRIKLGKKTALMGMDKSKHFALLAHADDNAAGLRNALGFELSRQLEMPWTPATAPLEVVLNGDYIGLYWLTETIRVDEDRVDVVEQADGSTIDVSGGWLVEIDNYDTDPHVTVMDSKGHPIWFTYKSPEELSPEQENYLREAMQDIQNAVSSHDEVAAATLVDFDILARYFIVNQVMFDMESFHGSCYLNRQRGLDNKWKFGPVWDFGNAFVDSRAEKPRFIFDRPDFSQVWIGEFYSMPKFVETVKDVWAEFLNSGPENVSVALRSTADEIAVAAIFDAERWPKYNHSDVAYRAARLEGYLDGSIAWLKEQWGNMAGVVPVKEENAIAVKADVGGVVITSIGDTTVTIAAVDGRCFTVKVSAGENRVELERGFYIVGGKKVVL